MPKRFEMLYSFCKTVKTTQLTQQQQKGNFCILLVETEGKEGAL